MPDHPEDTRDPKTGRYITKHLDSETARAMQARQAAHLPAREALLKEAGYADTPAPEHLRVLAEIAASKGSGSVAAMNAFLKLTSKPGDTSKPGKPGPGSICPLCGELVFTGYRPKKDDIDLAVKHID